MTNEPIIQCFCDCEDGWRELAAMIEIFRHEPHNTKKQAFELLAGSMRWKSQPPDMDHWPQYAQLVVEP